MNTIEYSVGVIADSIAKIKAVGLSEAWFSIEPELGPKLVSWAIDQGYGIEEADWAPPTGIYVGPGTPTGPLSVLAIKW